MDLNRKLELAAQVIDSIMTHDSETLENIEQAFEQLGARLKDALAKAQRRPREEALPDLATTEARIRAKIAEVRSQIEACNDEAQRALLLDMERTLGGLLPPIVGTLRIGAAPAEVEAR